MRTITLREYEKLPIMIDDDRNIYKGTLNIGDFVLLRENHNYVEIGDVVGIYEVTNIDEKGVESLTPITIKIIS